MKEKQYEELILELEEYRHKGALICLSGNASTPMRVADAMQVSEESCYMRDYVTGEDGCVKELHFERVPT